MMRLKIFCAAALAGLAAAVADLPLPARADTPEAEKCRTWLASRFTRFTADKVSSDGKGGCIFEPVIYDTAGPGGTSISFVWEIGRLTISGINPSSPALIPQAMRFEAEHIRFSYRTGSRTTDYIARQQMPSDAQMSLRVDYAYDEASKSLSLNDLYFTGPYLGTMKASAKLQAVPQLLFTATEVGQLDDVVTAATETGVTHLDFDFTDTGAMRMWSLPYVVPWLMSSAGPDVDPEVVVSAKIREAQTAVKAAMGSENPDAADALARFIGDWPRPRGRLRLRYDTRDPITPSMFRLAQGGTISTLSLIQPSLKRDVLSITYDH